MARQLRLGPTWMRLMFSGVAIGFVCGLGALVLFTKSVQVVNRPRSNNSSENIDASGKSILGAISRLQQDTRLVESLLRKQSRILCYVMTDPKGEDKRVAIMETWGKRCDQLLFMVGGKEMLQLDGKHSLPAKRRREIAANFYLIYLDMEKDHYDNLWEKTRLAFMYIDEYFRGTFDWILKVDDDSFIIMENLRLYLLDKGQNNPQYYGCQYKVTAPSGYASGGPGYVMSRTNAEKFAKLLRESANASGGECGTRNGPEDSRVAECLYEAGIQPADTRDSHGRFRFSIFQPEMTINHEIIPSKYNWFWGFTAQTLKKGFECCSDTAISFHYISPTMMRTMEYLIYYIHPFGDRSIWNRHEIKYEHVGSTTTTTVDETE